jgi:hypothetical protein
MSAKIPFRVSAIKPGEITRRSFLQVSGLLAGAVVMSPALTLRPTASDPRVEFHGALYQGTGGGGLLKSVDHGATWQQVFNFGPHLSVSALAVRDGQMTADLLVGTHSFTLCSMDGLFWKTI